jgi:hypothetical protein
VTPDDGDAYVELLVPVIGDELALGTLDQGDPAGLGAFEDQVHVGDVGHLGDLMVGAAAGQEEELALVGRLGRRSQFQGVLDFYGQADLV